MSQGTSSHDPGPLDPEPGVERDSREEGVAAGSSPRKPGGGSSDVAELERSIEESRESDADAEAEPAVPREVQLEAQIERLQSEIDVHRDKWLRAMAEFENYRKRARREMESSINLARADVLKQLLEVLDNFERALDAFIGSRLRKQEGALHCPPKPLYSLLVGEDFNYVRGNSFG